MSDVIFIKLLFVAGLLGLAGVAALLGYTVAWLQGRRTMPRASGRRDAPGPRIGGADRVWKTLL